MARADGLGAGRGVGVAEGELAVGADGELRDVVAAVIGDVEILAVGRSDFGDGIGALGGDGRAGDLADGAGLGVDVIGADLAVAAGAGAVGGDKEIVDGVAGAARGDAGAECQRGCDGQQSLTDFRQLHAVPSSLAGTSFHSKIRRAGRRNAVRRKNSCEPLISPFLLPPA